jgi:hypothetical protein
MERIEPSLGKPGRDLPIGSAATRTGLPRRLLWLLVLLVAVIIAAVLVWKQMHPQTPRVATPAPAQSAAAPPPIAPPSTGPEHPIEAAGESTPASALPALADSDAALQDALAALFGKAPLDRIFHLQQIVQRFVATIDNLPRPTASAQRMPVQPAAGTLATIQDHGQTVLSADNGARYTPYVEVLEAVDTGRLVAAYVHFYPLFQQAYEDLGYPGKYFNDRLIYVIDHLLAAPEPAGPVALVQPKIVYRYADPELESLSAGQKIMVRIGHDNEMRVKARLHAIRQSLTGHPPPR